MSERDNLLVSVANEIRTYRKGDLPEPTPEHVASWLHQFTPAQQLPFLREFDHVIKQTFITRKNVKEFLHRLVTNQKLAGDDPKGYWSQELLEHPAERAEPEGDAKALLEVPRKRVWPRLG